MCTGTRKKGTLSLLRPILLGEGSGSSRLLAMICHDTTLHSISLFQHKENTCSILQLSAGLQNIGTLNTQNSFEKQSWRNELTQFGV